MEIKPLCPWSTTSQYNSHPFEVLLLQLYRLYVLISERGRAEAPLKAKRRAAIATLARAGPSLLAAQSRLKAHAGPIRITTLDDEPGRTGTMTRTRSQPASLHRGSQGLEDTVWV